MNWIKSHKLLTAGIVAGVVALYYLYKNMQANAVAANSTAVFPAYPAVVGTGGGGVGGGLIATGPSGSQGNTQPGLSTALTQAVAPTAPVSSPEVVATIPGANPLPPVSAPAASDVSSAVVTKSSQGGVNIIGENAFGTGLQQGPVAAMQSSVYTGGYNLFKNGVYQGGPGGNAPAYDLPGSPNGWTGPAVPVPFIGGGARFPSSSPINGNTPMIPMASAGPSLPLNQPQPISIQRKPPIGGVQQLPGSLAA